MDESKIGKRIEFLLDTGVFRSLTKSKFERLLNIKQHVRLTASIVVPFELLSGIPEREAPTVEKEFRVRRAALSKYESLVGTEGTYWNEPHILKARAFGIKETTKAPISFQLLIKACIECESIDEVEAITKKAQSLSASMPSLDWLRQQADAVSENFGKSFDIGMNLVQTVTKSQLPQDKKMSAQSQKKMVRGFVPYLHEAGNLRLYAFLSLAEIAGAWNGKLPNSGLYEACTKIEDLLKARYDGSLDIYIDAFASYWMEKWLDGGEPHRNDSFDLDHILYLRREDTDQILVTTDKTLINRCLQTAPGRAINISEFLTQIAEISN